MSKHNVAAVVDLLCSVVHDTEKKCAQAVVLSHCECGGLTGYDSKMEGIWGPFPGASLSRISTEWKRGPDTVGFVVHREVFQMVGIVPDGV